MFVSVISSLGCLVKTGQYRSWRRRNNKISRIFILFGGWNPLRNNSAGNNCVPYMYICQ
ncbi:MAG: hypothetical protein LBU34_04375 [Planctomycetaceae bacterium]|nr:hypothetical protein [Planctomycetaceae bacterium]